MLRLLCLLSYLWGTIFVAHADEFLAYVGDGKPSRDFLKRLPKLREDPRFRGIEWKILHEYGENAEEERIFAESAIRDGVHYLPTIILSDDLGPYAKVVGAVSTQQGKNFEERLLLAMAQKSENRSRWEKRRKDGLRDTRLYSLLSRISTVDTTQKTALGNMIDETLAYISSEDANTELKQTLLLHAVYPMQMHLYALAYNGGHTPESEQLFLKAIDFLEKARDINPKNTQGRKAHKMREELRTARLRAAKLD